MHKPLPPNKTPLWKVIGHDLGGGEGQIKTETSILKLKSGFFLRTLSTKRGSVLSEAVVWVESSSPTELDTLEALIYGDRQKSG